MKANANPIRAMQFFDTDELDVKVHGARVTANGKEYRFVMHRIRALQQFKPHLDEVNNPLRPIGELTEDQLKYFASFDINFEPAELPGWFHPLTDFTVGKYYRQGF